MIELGRREGLLYLRWVVCNCSSEAGGYHCLHRIHSVS